MELSQTTRDTLDSDSSTTFSQVDAKVNISWDSAVVTTAPQAVLDDCDLPSRVHIAFKPTKMAVPNEMTTLDLSGKYIQNKSLSNDIDEILRRQGVSWYIRRVISYATIYHDVAHRVEDGVEKLTISQVLSGGFGSSTEERMLDWTERTVDDKLYGAMLVKSRRSQVQDIEKDYLRNGWSDDGKGVVETHAKSDTPKSGYAWSAQTTWGLEEIEVNGNKEKRYTRHIFFTDGEEILARLVYDYQGPLN